MSRPTHKMALNIPLPARDQLDPDMRKYFDVCDEKLGFVPNVLACYSFDQAKLRAFAGFYNDLMLAESELTKCEREMIAVVVSSANHCYYCLTAHGAAVRKLSGDPVLGEMLVMNFRVADLPPRQRAMLEFAHVLTTRPAEVAEEHRQQLRNAGFSDRAIWDIAAVTAFYNMSNRLAAAVEMMPNDEYHVQARQPAARDGSAPSEKSAP